MKSKPFYKQIKTIPYICLSFILINVTLSLIHFFGSVSNTTLLNVNVKQLNTKTYKSIDIGKDSFQTGTEGKLYWKVKNYDEAILVFVADRNSSLNLYDQFYVLVLDIALFIMVYRMKEGTVFSNQVQWGLRLIAGSVMLYPIINLIGYHLSSQCIEKLTNGQFTAQNRNLNILMFLLITYLLMFMAPFMRKAINLQTEQNLTI